MTQTTLYILYSALGLGAAGVALMLPSGRPDAARLRLGGAILAAACIGALGVYWTRWIGGAFEGRGFFVAFAAIAVIAAVRVITHPRPVYSALYFVLVVLAVTGLCILAAAEFLGIALVIVYAGAILVTYVFVIMLAQQSGAADYDRNAREPWAAVAMAFAVAAATLQAMSAGQGPVPVPVVEGETRVALAAAETIPVPQPAEQGNVRAVGATLMTTYVVAVELAGVLLLIAVVGAIAIAQKRIAPEALTMYERSQRTQDEDMHRAGREAKPF